MGQIIKTEVDADFEVEISLTNTQGFGEQHRKSQKQVKLYLHKKDEFLGRLELDEARYFLETVDSAKIFVGNTQKKGYLVTVK